MRNRSPRTWALAVLVAALSPLAVSAQSELASSEAAGFLGTWVIDMNTEYGPFTLDLLIEDQGGKVAVQIGSPDFGGMQEVTDVTREGESLILKYQAEAEGQVFPVMIELEPDGEALSVGFDAADGQFFARGSATKG